MSGIREGVTGKGSAADAAVRYLADKAGRYRIARPDRDLRVVSDGGGVLRFQQKHRGVDVLGGQYVVRMERGKGGGRIVTGTSGRYFTGLTVGTEPGIDAETAVARAVDSVEDQLRLRGPEREKETLSGTDHGLVVLPRGAGVLTRHVTVRGDNPADGTPVLYEVYVEAQSGYPLLQYSGIKSFTAPKGTGGSGTSHIRTAAADDDGTKGSGTRLDGKTVELGVEHDGTRKEYLLRDRSRPSGGTVATWDARGVSLVEVLGGGWPSKAREFGSPTPAFGKEPTDLGAIDAHWGAGKVLDYYKDVHGRNGWNGRGAPLNSLVGVGTWEPFLGVFWDGGKMVYGGGDKEHLPFSAGLDVIGYEMTHGVVQSSAELVPAGQPGAVGEAVADYFGNAVQTDTFGLPMDSPDSGLLGETLCRTKGPRECAARDMNDGRTASGSFLGVPFLNDNGGVHLNSTIFSGALWDIRKDLDHRFADRIVYKALTEYMTPLDGFTEARNAVLAAARDLQATGTQLRAVERAFNAHGIVPGWELATGVDSDLLLGTLNTRDASAGAGGGWWVTSKSNDDGSEPYSVWAGRLDGTGEKKLISPNDGRFHTDAVTDGKTVVWEAWRGYKSEVLARPLAGGPIKVLYSNSYHQAHVSSLHVEGKTVTFEAHRHRGGSRVVYLRMGETDPTEIRPGSGGQYHSTNDPSLRDGRIAFTSFQRGGSRTEVLDVATGRRTVMGQLGKPLGTGRTAITGRYVYWLVWNDWQSGTTAVRRADLDGTGVVDISPDTGKDALRGVDLTASDDAVTLSAHTPDERVRNETPAKLWQLSPDGANRGRMSCNRGEQSTPAATGPTGRQVVWVDSTTGSDDLVTRARPAGRCG
ncbi:M4 family metallopeptidase [Streptomyces luteireticuli]|uniref:M4 family metallopeptidase n=1 Tax=Streptomyces luteireticuli TaxID=173858 RepID=UPI0031DBC26D